MVNKKGKITLSVLILSVILISVSFGYFVVAVGEDNIKTFEKDDLKYGKISILEDSTKLAEYTLLENSDQCLIDCYAEGIATFYTNGYLFEDLKFKNKEDQLTSINSNKILIEITDEWQVDIKDYKEVCETSGNGTKVCTNELAGTHEETRSKSYWEEYDNSILSSGEYKWRIEGKKNNGENVDWIASSFGKEFSEWAWWNSTWLKKKEITITNTNASAFNSAIVEITIPRPANMKSDCGDARFLNSAETGELPFLIWNCSTNITFFVNTSLVASGNTTIYMYYNNSGATSTSSEDNIVQYSRPADMNGTLETDWQTTERGSEFTADQNVKLIRGYTIDGVDGTRMRTYLNHVYTAIDTIIYSGNNATFDRYKINASDNVTISVDDQGSVFNFYIKTPMTGTIGPLTWIYGQGSFPGWTNDGAQMYNTVGADVIPFIYPEPSYIIGGEKQDDANYTITFNLTDSITGVTLPITSNKKISITCNPILATGLIQINPYTSPNPFPTGVHSCDFTASEYFSKTQNITVTQNETIEISMSKTDSLTIEEHGWLEAVHDCLINGIGCAA